MTGTGTDVEGRRARPGGHEPRGSAGRWGIVIPLTLVVVGAASYLQAPPNVYDGGLILTLARFTGFSRVPYRDLWTLYGPGPPVLGSIVDQLFGPGLLPSRLSFLLVQALLVGAVYVLARRYVAWWWAAAFAAVVATFGFSHSHFHFAQSLSLLLWGVWFVLRWGDQPDRGVRRAVFGAFLLGMSFWGRYEFALISPVLVVGLWWSVRPRLSRSAGRWMLIAGLAPTLLFAVYLLGVVGWERAYLNLIDYPVFKYPDPGCRGGLPEVWNAALHALLAPLRGRVWSGQELTLWAGTFAPPVLGVLAVIAGYRRRGERSARMYAMIAIGLVTLFVWAEHRVRAGPEPHPTWPLILVSLAMLTATLHRPRATTWLSGGTSALLVLTMLVSWLPDRLPPWTDWPQHRTLYGFARIEEEGLYDARVWSDVTELVHTHASPEEEIFVSLTDNRSHFANAPIFYWLTDRPPASRFIELSPCLTDTADVQRLIVADLIDTDVIVATSFFPFFDRTPPPELRPPPRVLDDYIEANFSLVYEAPLGLAETIRVLVRGVTQSGTPGGSQWGEAT